MATYRSNVAAILQREDGKILVAERSDFPGSWGFPQGGVDEGEDLISALHREVEEEIGLSSDKYRLIGCRTGYRYKFPEGKLKKGKFCGQAQTYFLCAFEGEDSDIDLHAHIPEFRSWRWIRPQKFKLRWVPPFQAPCLPARSLGLLPSSPRDEGEEVR